MPAARSYSQFCGLARALDVVGDRWSLLIVRELLISPARYGELYQFLAGAATNLLADRLRGLENSGVIERRLDVERGCVVYALTEWGEGLREPVEALVRWSAPLVAAGRGQDAFNARWLVLALQAIAGDRTSPRPVAIGIAVDGAELTLRRDKTGTSVTLGFAPRPATVLSADPETVFSLAAGVISVRDAVTAGGVEGDPRELAAVFASTATPPPPSGSGLAIP